MDKDKLLEEVKQELLDEQVKKIKYEVNQILHEKERCKSILDSLDKRLEVVLERCENL